jgi:hypothetical protein
VLPGLRAFRPDPFSIIEATKVLKEWLVSQLSCILGFCIKDGKENLTGLKMDDANRRTQRLGEDDIEQDLVMRIGALPFEQDRDTIKLFVPDHSEVLSVKFELDGKAIVGRFSENEGEVVTSSTITTMATDNRSRFLRLAKLPKADRDKVISLYNDPNLQRINMTPFDGEAMGVSREHAALFREDTILTLTDLGSTNGTYLNGLPLPAYQSRIVRDRDELRLGMLRLVFQFGV